MELIHPEQLEQQVYAALKRAFSAVIGANPGQSFYSFGLFTDDSLQFLYPVANTEEALTATVSHYREKFDPKFGSTTTRDVMRWACGDWGFFPDVGGDAFKEINAVLSSNFARMIDDDTFDGSLDLLWPAILRAFQRVEAEAFFGTGSARSKVTLLLAGDLPDELIHKWVTALNPPDIAEHYIHWDCQADLPATGPAEAFIRAPMIGTFYRAPGPGEAPFVSVGDTVDLRTTVCILEAMKVRCEIYAEKCGVITKVMVEDGTPVPFDSPLFAIQPA